MPWAAPRFCTRAGHPSFTGARCPLCTKATYQAQDAHRGSAASRGYNAAWRRLRQRILATEPLCRFCAEEGKATAAVDVDHIQPFTSMDDPRRLDPSNLRPLCKSHHSARTARDQAFGRGSGADTQPPVARGGIGGSVSASAPAGTAPPASRATSPKLGAPGKGCLP